MHNTPFEDLTLEPDDKIKAEAWDHARVRPKFETGIACMRAYNNVQLLPPEIADHLVEVEVTSAYRTIEEVRDVCGAAAKWWATAHGYTSIGYIREPLPRKERPDRPSTPFDKEPLPF